jgi:hypothetical protein
MVHESCSENLLRGTPSRLTAVIHGGVANLTVSPCGGPVLRHRWVKWGRLENQVCDANSTAGNRPPLLTFEMFVVTGPVASQHFPPIRDASKVSSLEAYKVRHEVG